MRFTQVLAFAASGLLVAATPKLGDIDLEGLEAFKQLDNPEAFEVFKGVLDGKFPSLAGRETQPEKRQGCCQGPCCKPGTCDGGQDVTFCLWQCANIPNAAGQAGCIAGCWVACG
ncbi:hypothetical protein BDW68DRAFT_180390 [Aspergillus falconensis]